MSAHVTVHPDTAPVSRAVCPECDWAETHPRTRTAQDAARAHNLDQHAYPEQTLEIPEETR